MQAVWKTCLKYFKPLLHSGVLFKTAIPLSFTVYVLHTEGGQLPLGMMKLEYVNWIGRCYLIITLLQLVCPRARWFMQMGHKMAATRIVKRKKKKRRYFSPVFKNLLPVSVRAINGSWNNYGIITSLKDTLYYESSFRNQWSVMQRSPEIGTPLPTWKMSRAWTDIKCND